MPKFITYQRPVPVNKAAWGGKPGANPPARRSPPAPQPTRRPGLDSMPGKAK